MAIEARSVFPATNETPAAVRRFVRDVVAQGTLECRVDDLDLLVSEVVTNAVLHGGGASVEVTVSDHGSAVRVGVVDSNPDQPVVGNPDPQRPNGRGMLLVDRIATRWGTDVLPGKTKRVWFEC